MLIYVVEPQLVMFRIVNKLLGGLFGGGFHGNNGLDPETLIHLFNTYITPVLMYGMELIIHHTLLSLVWLYVYDNTFSWLKFVSFHWDA
jgi:hypothetical protein